MDPLISIAVAVALSLVLSVVAWKTGMLTGDGAIVAAIVLLVIGTMGGLDWLLMLVIFAFIGFTVTKIAFSKKKEKGVQEGKSGERSWKNIVGVALAPAIVSIVNFAIPGHQFTGQKSEYHRMAASDTSSESVRIRERLITNLRVMAGTNGVFRYGS